MITRRTALKSVLMIALAPHVPKLLGQTTGKGISLEDIPLMDRLTYLKLVYHADLFEGSVAQVVFYSFQFPGYVDADDFVAFLTLFNQWVKQSEYAQIEVPLNGRHMLPTIYWKYYVWVKASIGDGKVGRVLYGDGPLEYDPDHHRITRNAHIKSDVAFSLFDVIVSPRDISNETTPVNEETFKAINRRMKDFLVDHRSKHPIIDV